MGARFETLAAANAALQDIRKVASVAPGDAAVGLLGSMRYEAPSTDFVLGGRFADGDVEDVIRIVEAHGGRIIESRPDVPAGGRGAPGRAAVTSNPPWTATWTAPTAAAGAPRRVPKPNAGPRLRKRLRRPVARGRVRAARVQRLADRGQ